MKPIAPLLALALCALLGCSVNDDPVYSPVYPCPSFSDVRPASAMPDDGNSDANGRAGDPSNDDPTAIDAGESHAGRYVGDYGVSVPTDNRPRDVKMLELNCRKLEAAVDEFASLAGRYPEDVDADRTPGGKTVIDLLPDDHLLSDPYGRARRAPVSHSAVLTGEIGYAVVHEGVARGYVITGVGRVAGANVIVIARDTCMPHAE